MDQQLVNFICSEEQKGRSDEQIVAQLLQSGYRYDDIQAAFLALQHNTFQNPRGQVTPTALPSAAALLRTSWQFYKFRFKTFAVIIGIAEIFAVGMFLCLWGVIVFFEDRFHVTYHTENYIGMVAFAAIGFMILWCTAALFAVTIHAQQLTVKQAFLYAKGKLLGFFFVLLLTALTLSISYLFLAVPGILLLPRLLFAPFVQQAENVKGFHILTKSVHYAKGAWWYLMSHITLILVLLLVTYILPIVAVSLVHIENTVAVANMFVLPWLLPFVIVYLFQIYQSVCLSQEPRYKKRTLAHILGGIFGILLLLLPYLLFAITVYFVVAVQIVRHNPINKQRLQDLRVIQQALETYYKDTGEYPNSLTELQPRYVQKLPVDPRYRTTYPYKVTDENQGYTLCPHFDDIMPLGKFGCHGRLHYVNLSPRPYPKR